MNNIELRLIAERNWREENLLKCMKIHVKKPANRPSWDAPNNFTALLGFILCYNQRVFKN